MGALRRLGRDQGVGPYVESPIVCRYSAPAGGYSDTGTREWRAMRDVFGEALVELGTVVSGPRRARVTSAER
jgi:hypothetical protein